MSNSTLDHNQYLAKVRYKDDTIFINIACKDEEDECKKIEYSSKQKPHPDFFDALRNLQQAAREILQLPSDYRRTEMNISGVSWSNSSDIKGAVITGTIGLDTSNSPFCFNTPHLPYEPYSEGNNNPIMPTQCRKLLEKLEEETLAFFLNSKKAQLDMFVENN